MEFEFATTVARNLIGGEHVDAADGAVAERFDPGDRRRLVAVAPDSGVADAAAAVAAAEAASAGWARRRLTDRLAIIDAALTELEADAEEIAVLTVLESGKTLEECRGEVVRAIATVRFQLEAAAEVATHAVYDEGGVAARLDRLPAGIAVVITPWNFPFSALLRKIVPALAMGNAVIAKPSELSPASSLRIGEAFVAAGLPGGVLGIVHGRGGVVGAALLADPRIAAVSFTGSTVVGLGIAASAGSRDLKVQLEMGGKNPLVVLADADLDRAVSDAASGAFTAAGQWCVATSRVIVEEPVAVEFSERLAARAASLRVGHGLAPRSEMGALVSAAHFAKVSGALDVAQREARILSGGAALADAEHEHGHFVAPTVLADADPGSSLLRDEIFGPVVVVETVSDLDEAVKSADSGSYGLSASVYTASRSAADRFIAETTTGKINVNRPPNFGDARLPSSGRRDSGRGESEGAESGLAFYTHERAVFIDRTGMDRR